MSSVPMPRDLSEEAVAEWLDDILECGDIMGSAFRRTARAVRALVEREVAKERASTREKVREAVMLAQTIDQLDDEPWRFAYSNDEIVSRVMGEQPKAGQGAEGDQVPRG